MENKRLFFAQKCVFSSIMGNYKQKKEIKQIQATIRPERVAPPCDDWQGLLLEAVGVLIIFSNWCKW
jgi:hypothetical protein